MSQRVKAVKANLYSVHWRADASGGHHQRCRVLAISVEDSMNATRPLHGNGDVDPSYTCISAHMLYEGIHIAKSETVDMYICHEFGQPYEDDKFAESLK